MARPCQGAGAVHPINGKLQDECLKREIFYSLREAQVVIGAWRDHYNRVRPHSALGYRPPAPVSLEVVARHLPTPALMQ
jgi:putative transposase